jgi:HEAT repeat protein
VLLEEEILLALGRCGEPMAIELLLNVLANPLNRHRAAACLALGMVGRKGAEATLARFLLDGDPWVRFCAALSLAHLTGDAPKVDWMYAAPAVRSAAAEDWLRRLEGR